jgi:hypothetical protein
MKNPEEVVEGKIKEFELSSEPFALSNAVVKILESWRVIWVLSMKRSSAEAVIYAIVDVVNRYTTHVIVRVGFSSHSQETTKSVGFLLYAKNAAFNNTEAERADKKRW